MLSQLGAIASVSGTYDSCRVHPWTTKELGERGMEDDDETETETLSTASLVGVPRDPCGHTEGTIKAYESAAKWIDATLLRLGSKREDLIVEGTLEPNNTLCSQVHGMLATWSVEGVTAAECDVVCEDAFLHRPPPQQVLVKARNWMLRYINTRRAEEPHRLQALQSDWGERLAGRRGNTRAVNQESRERRAAFSYTTELVCPEHALPPFPLDRRWAEARAARPDPQTLSIGVGRGSHRPSAFFFSAYPPRHRSTLIPLMHAEDMPGWDSITLLR